MKNIKKSTKSTNISIEYLAENIKKLLDAYQINESELARKLDVPYNTIHRIANGTTSDPRISTLQQIADYFGLSLDAILSKTQEHNFITQKENLIIPILNWDTILKQNFAKDLDKANWKKWIQTSQIKTVKDINQLFALESTKSMQPRFPSGTTFIIDPNENPIDGDLVLIRFRDTSAVSLRELVIDSPDWQLNAVIPGSAPLVYKINDHEIMGVVILTIIQTRTF